MGSKLKVLFEIAFRNLFASKINWVIGAVIFVATLIVTVGSSLLDSVDGAMSQSIRGSVAGDIQIYAAKSKEDVSLFGNMGGEANLSPIGDFDAIAKAMQAIPNVKAVVPMGINAAMVTNGNTVDLTLAELRQAITKKESPERIASLSAHVRQIVSVLQQDLKRLDAISAKSKELEEDAADIQRAASDAFWTEFASDPLSALEFLENRIAPLVEDGDLLYLRYVGTDLDDYAATFDRLEIIDGTAVPKGQRGFLFNKRVYEDMVKLKTAHRLDKIKEAREAGQRIATDATLQRYVKENKTQPREIMLQLDPQRTAKAITLLQRGLGSQSAGLEALLAELFDTNDDNFDARYKLFYDGLAPLLQLYSLRIGDTLTIKAFTRSGYVQSVNVTIYGTFQFKGLEKAGLSGNINLMDLMSFRQLYGFLTAEKLGEIEAIKKEAGAKVVTRESAEADLFGDDTRTIVAEATPGLIDDDKQLPQRTRDLHREDLVKRVYSKDEIRSGLVLNAAITLHDKEKLAETMAEVERVSQAANLDLKVVSWQTAAGLIGQFVLLMKLALYFAVFIIFVVLLVIINNAVMMATMQRVRELGTMRAIGSQRSFVLAMILLETTVLGGVFGGAGTVAGAGLMAWLHRVGIAATTEEAYFFFSGPRLFPTLGLSNIVVALVIVLLVTTISTLYPAFLAARISPLAAMQSDE